MLLCSLMSSFHKPSYKWELLPKPFKTVGHEQAVFERCPVRPTLQSVGGRALLQARCLIPCPCLTRVHLTRQPPGGLGSRQRGGAGCWRRRPTIVHVEGGRHSLCPFLWNIRAKASCFVLAGRFLSWLHPSAALAVNSVKLMNRG